MGIKGDRGVCKFLAGDLIGDVGGDRGVPGITGTDLLAIIIGLISLTATAICPFGIWYLIFSNGSGIGGTNIPSKPIFNGGVGTWEITSGRTAGLGQIVSVFGRVAGDKVGTDGGTGLYRERFIGGGGLILLFGKKSDKGIPVVIKAGCLTKVVIRFFVCW